MDADVLAPCHDWHQAISWTNDDFCQLDPKDQTSVKFESKYNEENIFQIIVCKMSAIFLRPKMCLHRPFAPWGQNGRLIGVMQGQWLGQVL